MTLFPKFKMDPSGDSVTPATLEPEIEEKGLNVAKVAESQRIYNPLPQFVVLFSKFIFNSL